MHPSFRDPLDAHPLVRATRAGDVALVLEQLPGSVPPARYRATLAAMETGHQDIVRALLPALDPDQRRVVLSVATTENYPDSLATLLQASAEDPACAIDPRGVIAVVGWSIRKRSPHLALLLPTYQQMGISDKQWREDLRSAVGSGDVATVEHILQASGQSAKLLDRGLYLALVDNHAAIIDHLLPRANLLKVGKTLVDQRQVEAIDALAPHLNFAKAGALLEYADSKHIPAHFLPVLQSHHEHLRLQVATPKPKRVRARGARL